MVEINLRPNRIPCLADVSCPYKPSEFHQCILVRGHDGPHWDHGMRCIPFGMEWTGDG